MSAAPAPAPPAAGPGAGPVLLEASDIVVQFEGVRALDGVSIEVRAGEVLGLIGPNGAGKTTLMNVLSGFQRPTAGSVRLGPRDVTRWGPERLARAGVARTFQAVRPFRALTVGENVQVAALGTGAGGREARRRTAEVLEAMGLADRAQDPAGSLPHGDERRLGIARALAGRPEVLLLDEPAAGTNEAESDQLGRALMAVRRDFGCTLVVIEHDMRLIMGISERIQVLDHGRTIASGDPDDVRTDPQVLEAYLGHGLTERHRAEG